MWPLCSYDMCSGHRLPRNRPRIDKTDLAIRPCVVIRIYNFDKAPLEGRDDESVNPSF
jgi:hypothetical protein